MATIFTRPAQHKDLRQLQQMIAALAEFHGDTASLTLHTLDQTLFGPQPWMSAIVAASEDQLVGYAALGRLFQLQFGIRGMDLHHLFVASDKRGKGIGQSLIKASVRFAQSCDCRFLNVGTHPDNTAAQEMYLANGFEFTPNAAPKFRMRLS